MSYCLALMSLAIGDHTRSLPLLPAEINDLHPSILTAPLWGVICGYGLGFAIAFHDYASCFDGELLDEIALHALGSPA